VQLGLQAAKDAGLSVFRTWGFNDKNTTYDPNGLPQYGSEGAGATDVVFQWFANGTSTIDISAFDKVVEAATKVGIKLIVTFTNNWADYGGMDVYTLNLGGQYHDDVGFGWSPYTKWTFLLTRNSVLHSPQDQGRIQALHQDYHYPLSRFSNHLRLGTGQ
jgi:hypothetical protein